MQLMASGNIVRAAVRARTAVLPPGVEVIDGLDLDKIDNWSEALHGCSAVIHCAAHVHDMKPTQSSGKLFGRINATGTESLAKLAAGAGVGRFVLLSSIKVNGEFTSPGRPFRAADVPAPQDAYANSKLAAERALAAICQSSRMEYVVVRPPLVYGPGVKANFRSLINAIHKGMPLPFASLRNRRSFIGLQNLVDLLVHCLSHPRAANRVFLASDDEDLTMPELVGRIAVALGVAPRLFHMPPAVLKAALSVLGRKEQAFRLCRDLQVDISETRADLDWRPRVGMDQCLQEAAQHFLRTRDT